MERKKIIDLIKLEVLNCLNEKDREELKVLRLTADDFPWKELAEYQLIAALLPSVLEIRNPASEIKDKTALKLYNIRDEIKAKIEAKKALETVVIPQEEKLEQGERTEFGELIEVNEKVAVEEEVAVAAEEGIKLSGAEPIISREDNVKVFDKYKHKKSTDNFYPETRDVVEPVFSKQPPDKDLIEKIAREYFNSHFTREIEPLKQNLKQSRILSIIFFAVTLILLALVFFIK